MDKQLQAPDENRQDRHFLAKLRYLPSQLCYLMVIFMMGYTGYLIVQSLLGRKKSMLILLISNLYSKFFSKKAPFYINFWMKREPHKWFDGFEWVVEDGPIVDKNVMMPLHPHSIWPMSIYYMMHIPGNPFEKFQSLGSRQLCYFAPHGLLLRMWDLDGVDPDTMRKYMQKGTNIFFCPGGFEEATITSCKEYRLFITKRKGFIKYALKYGYQIRPVFTFNENKMFETSDFLLKQRVRLNKYKIPSAIFYSKYGFLLPNPFIHIYVIIGKPIELPHIPKPTKSDVDLYHNIYMQQLRQLFDRHVHKCDPGAKLIFDNQLFSKL